MLTAVAIGAGVPEDPGGGPETKPTEFDPSITLAGSRIQFLNFEIDGSESYTINITENTTGKIEDSPYTRELNTGKGNIRLFVVLFTYPGSEEITSNGSCPQLIDNN